MTPTSHPDVHPDTDSLNGFVEHVLPETERQSILAHIAGCSWCREVVYLAHEAASSDAETIPEMLPFPRYPTKAKKSVAGWRFAWLTGAALAAMIALTMFLHVKPSFPTEKLAHVSPAQPKDNESISAEYAKGGTVQTPPQLGTAEHVPGKSALPASPLGTSRHQAAVAPFTGAKPESPFTPPAATPAPATAASSAGLSAPRSPHSQNEITEALSQNTVASNTSGPTLAGRKRIAVLNFGYDTVKNQVQAYFGTDKDIGKGISDQLITRLLDGGDYRIIDRNELDKILNEQNFSNGERANPATAAKIGGLLGVDAMVIGDITVFGNDDRHFGGNGGSVYAVGGMLGSLHVRKSKTIVEITARMVDVKTGGILASVSGRGEVMKSGMTGGGGNGWSGGDRFDMGSSNFQQSAIGQAVKGAVTHLATELDANAASVGSPTEKLTQAVPPLDGLVADISNGEIIVNVGSKNGLKVGDSLNVLREGEVIQDPVTGKVLSTLETPIGTLRVTSVDYGSASGKFTGVREPLVGDHVKRPIR